MSSKPTDLKTRWPATLLAAPLCSLLWACAAGPDYVPLRPEAALPEAAAPDAGGSGPAGAPAEAWWRSFGDPGLDDIVQAARSGSPDLAAAQARIGQARAALAGSQAGQWLQVDAQARAGRDHFSRDSENFANIPLPDPKTTFADYRAGLDASWEIDLFGHTRRGIEAARARADLAREQAREARLRVTAETTRIVLDWRHLQRRIDNARALVAANEEILRLVTLQRDAGLASTADAQQAEVSLRAARALLPPLEAAADEQVAALVPLTALSGGAIRDRLATVPATDALPGAQRFAVSSAVLEHRPDVRAAERAVAAASADLGVAVADLYPRFTLVGSAGWDSVQPGQLGRRASEAWSLGPQLYLPILTGGRVRAQVDAAQAARDEAVAGYRGSVLAALADVESAMLRCQGDDGRLLQASAASELLSRQVGLAGLRVQAGEAARIDLASAQAQWRAQEDARIIAHQSLADDLVLLFKALGTDPDAQAPLP